MHQTHREGRGRRGGGGGAGAGAGVVGGRHPERAEAGGGAGQGRRAAGEEAADVGEEEVVGPVGAERCRAAAGGRRIGGREHH